MIINKHKKKTFPSVSFSKTTISYPSTRSKPFLNEETISFNVTHSFTFQNITTFGHHFLVPSYEICVGSSFSISCAWPIQHDTRHLPQRFSALRHFHISHNAPYLPPSPPPPPPLALPKKTKIYIIIVFNVS